MKKRNNTLSLVSKIISIASICGLLAVPYLADASNFADFGGPGAPAITVGPSSTNVVTMAVTIPDAWNGGAFTADIAKKAGANSFWQGDSLNSIPALGTTSGVGYKEDGTGGFQGTEPVVRDLDADSAYTSAADTTIAGVPPAAGTTITTTKDADWTSVYFYDAVGGGAWSAAADLIFNDDGNVYYDIGPDTLEAGTGAENTLGTLTEPANWGLYYYDAVNGNVYNGGLDWIGRDDDADQVYTSAADVIYIDQADLPLAGNTYYDVVAADQVCSDNSDLAAASCVYTDSGGDCDATDGDTHTYYMGAACGTATDTLIVTGDNWMTTDDTIDNTTDFIKENVAEELTYSAAADATIDGVAPVAGTAIVNAKDADWTLLYFYDAVAGGGWNAGTDLIFNDSGFVYYDIGLDTYIAGNSVENQLGNINEPANWNLFYYDAVNLDAWNNAADWLGTDDGGSGTFSTSADVDVYSTGGLSNADALANFAADCDGGGAGTQACAYTGSAPIDAGDSILVDQGTAAGAAPNAVVDKQADQLIGIGVTNALGNAVNPTDIGSVYIFRDGPSAGWTGDEVLLGAMTRHSVNQNEWRLDISATPQAVSAGGLSIFVTADITATPTHGRTLQFAIPIYNDTGADNIANSDGDLGVFMSSNNDGPLDAGIANGAAQTIDALPPTLQSFTSTTVDGTYGPGSNINVTATYNENIAGGSLMTVTLDNGVNVTLNNIVGSTISGTYTVGVTGSGEDSADLTVASILSESVADSYGNIQGSSAVPGSPNNIADTSAIVIDTTAPTITEVTPVPTPTNNQNPSYTLNTDEAIGLSWAGGCDSVTGAVGTGNQTVTLDADGAGAVLPAATYNCTLTGTDGAGNAGNLIMSAFTVDITAPSITAAQLEDTDNDGYADRIGLTWDEALFDTASAANGFDVTSASDHGSCVGESADPDGTNSVDVDFTCSIPYTDVGDMNLSLTQNAGVRDAAGNQSLTTVLTAISAPAIIDAADPVILTTSPANSASGVGIAQDVVVTFSEPMNTGTVTQTSVPDPTGWSVVWTSGNTVATYSHAVNFNSSTAYTEQITAGQDTNGRNLAAGPVANPWTFTTGAPSGGGGGGTVSPINYSLLINNGSAQTNSSIVTLKLSAENAAYMLISEDPDFTDANWQAYATTKTFTLSSGYGTKNVYAKFKSSTNNQSSRVSDSIQYVETITEEPVEEPTPEPSEGEYPSGLVAGDLVKTSDSSSVYVLGADSKRHAFPNEDVYFSWYADFSQVKVISSSVLASIPLGKNATMRPGTWLIKVKSLPNVYAVEPGGVIRWIENQGLAEELYGSTWNEMIKDVSDAFWSNYTPNGSISEVIHPTGAVIQYNGQTAIYFIENGATRYLTADAFAAGGFRHMFTIKNVSGSISYPAGGDYAVSSTIKIMGL
ncbi:MAG: Ig-like domain-containing protein [Patescibacteria group bacterium]